MILDNFRIVRLDEYCLTFEEYKGVTNPITKEMKYKWVRSGGYYGTVDSCLVGLKNYIIKSYMEIEDYQEVLDKIKALNDAIVSVDVKPDKRRKHELDIE